MRFVYTEIEEKASILWIWRSLAPLHEFLICCIYHGRFQHIQYMHVCACVHASERETVDSWVSNPIWLYSFATHIEVRLLLYCWPFSQEASWILE